MKSTLLAASRARHDQALRDLKNAEDRINAAVLADEEDEEDDIVEGAHGTGTGSNGSSSSSSSTSSSSTSSSSSSRISSSSSSCGRFAGETYEERAVRQLKLEKEGRLGMLHGARAERRCARDAAASATRPG